MKKLIYLIVLTLILGLVLTGCLLSNVGQVPTTEQSGITYLTKTVQLPDPGLIGLWRFNGNADDSSGYGNDGTVVGATFVVGKYEQALSFDGNDYVEVSNSPSIEFLGKSNITMEAWVYPESYHATNRSIILEHIAQYYLTIDKSGKLAVYFYGVSPAGYYVSTLQVPLDTWTHVAATYNGSSVQLYINGALSGSTSTSGTISYASGWSDQPLRMGYERPGLTRYFQGIIDEVRIWSSALTAGQLDDRMAPAITITTPDNGATYLLNQTVNADWSAWDGTETGVASEIGTVLSGSAIDTGSVGTKPFTVTAEDYAKNEANKTVTYYVNYDFNGFLPPVSLGKPFKGGSTIPIKFQLTDAQGAFITNALPSISLKLLSNGTPNGEVIDGESSGAANTGNIFRYDPNSNQYIFNLATKDLTAPATYEITVDLGDGTTQQVNIGLK